MRSCFSISILLLGQISEILNKHQLIRKLIKIFHIIVFNLKYKNSLTISTESATSTLMTKFDVVSNRDVYAYLQNSIIDGYDNALIQKMTRVEFEILRNSK